MIRLCLALLVSFSLVLPGAVMASSDHHQHFEAGHSDHTDQSPHHDHQRNAADDGEGESQAIPMCCHIISGHCTTAGVLEIPPWTAAINPFARTKLLIAKEMLRNGRSFEADTPPPRT